MHIFTAMGAGIALIALLEAVREHWAAMFAWLGLALVIDALDGPIARRLDVVRLQPDWSGEVLDLVVDFVTYVFVPAYAITASGMLLPVAAPLLGVGIVDYQRAVFRGSPHEDGGQSFPRISGAVECGGVLSVPAAPVAGACRALASPSLIVLTFVPFNVIHPVRVERLRGLTLSLIGIWAVLAIYTLFYDFNVAMPVTVALCAIAVYVVASDAVIRLIEAGQPHDRTADQSGSMGRAADPDGAGNRARHRQRDLSVGDRVAHPGEAGEAGAADRPRAGAACSAFCC